MWKLQISQVWVTPNCCVVTLESLFIVDLSCTEQAKWLLFCSVLSSGFCEMKESYSLPPVNCLEHGLTDYVLGSFCYINID